MLVPFITSRPRSIGCLYTATALTAMKKPFKRVGSPQRDANASVQRNILLALGWYYSEIHHGVARFARDHGWHVTADLEDPVPKLWNGDGVLTHLGAKLHIWRKLQHLDVPIVDLTESRPEIPLARVTMDNAAIGRMGAEYFLDRGYRNFAFFHRWDMGVSRQRRKHFQDNINVAGHRCDIFCWQRERKGRPDTRDWRHKWLIQCLAELPKPLAVFTLRDIEAVEVIEACLSADLVVPDQVSVLGVDNFVPVCDCLRVPLSSIDNNLEQVGYEGSALLEKLIRGDPAPRNTIYSPPRRVIERRSTECLAVEHPKVAAALRFILDHSHEQICTTDLVKYVAMSRSGLEKAFREHYIRAPMEELRHVRLIKAKKMLLETDKKIIAIARLTGHQTPHNLCRIFHQQMEMTPKQYRCKHRDQAVS